jgi:uncharacterized membrane protein YidH (DUF202 family)
MRGMVIIGVILIALGVIGLVAGGVSYTKDKDTADLGPIDISVEEKERVAIPRAVSIGAVVAGVVVLLMGMRRRSA